MSRFYRTARVESRGIASIRIYPQLESLEGRTLLTATLPLTSSGVAVPIGGPVTTAPAALVTTIPVTIQTVVGAAFAGDVGMITGLPASTLPRLTATIKWGSRGAATPGTLSFDSAGVLHVQGQHTYAKVGTYAVTVSVIQNPPPGSLAPSRLYVINSKANVTQNSSGGVTIHPVLRQPFSGIVGTFSFPLAAPMAVSASPVNYVFSATINWGDGKRSAGKVGQTSTGAYSVQGNHTYTARGTYRISITVTGSPPVGPGPTPIAMPMFLILVANILSTAVVNPVAPAA